MRIVVFLGFLLIGGLESILVSGAGGATTTQLSPDMISAFDRYAGQRESQIRGELRDPNRFLWVDRLQDAAKQKAYSDARAGKVVIDSGKRTEVPKGLIHHWTGMVFIPGVKINDTLKFVQDYNNHAAHYSPDVMKSRLVSQNGSNYKIYMRFLKKKVITVVLDTDHDVTYDYINSQYAASIGRTTRVAEVDDAGTSSEKVLAPGQGMGFLYKMDTYWRFAERDNGMYVQCETISLSRDIPYGLGIFIGKFINSVPQESLNFTLARTRDQVLKFKK